MSVLKLFLYVASILGNACKDYSSQHICTGLAMQDTAIVEALFDPGSRTKSGYYFGGYIVYLNDSVVLKAAGRQTRMVGTVKVLKPIAHVKVNQKGEKEYRQGYAGIRKILIPQTIFIKDEERWYSIYQAR